MMDLTGVVVDHADFIAVAMICLTGYAVFYGIRYALMLLGSRDVRKEYKS